MSLNFSQFRCLTFDCYGTLIDWETGILGTLGSILKARGVAADSARILQLYSEIEPAIQADGYLRYREVLRRVVAGLAERFGFTASEAEMNALPESLKTWPPFPDTVAALGKLKSKYQLAIISNTDDDLFAQSAKLLQVPFDFVVTAQQARSYKPSLNNFHAALQRIGLPSSQIL